MKKLSLLLLLVSILNSVYAQTDSLRYKNIQKTKNDYISFITKGNRLFAVNSDGKIVIWNLETLDTLQYPGNNKKTQYTAIGTDRQGHIYAGTAGGKVYKIDDSTFARPLYIKDEFPIIALHFNTNNELFLIEDRVLCEPEKNSYWKDFPQVPKSGISRVGDINGEEVHEYFEAPSYSFIDRQDRIWMTKSMGEFGGSLQLFDAKERKILSGQIKGINMDLFFPKSVSEDASGNIYISSGLQHFSNFGEIYKIGADSTATLIFEGKDLFIGPGAYNPVDSCFYFATNKGFYKGKPGPDELLEATFLFKTTLHWNNEPLAIGSQMAIKQITFLSDNRMLFLTTADGFGIYDGQSVTLFK